MNHKFNDSKNCQKMVAKSYNWLYIDQTKTYFKKRPTSCPAPWDALSNKKKILIYWMNLGEEFWDALFGKCKLRKSEKHFLIFQKIAGFSNRGWRKSLKILEKKAVSRKTFYQLWKSRSRAIFLCIYLNFDDSDEKWLFLRGGP